MERVGGRKLVTGPCKGCKNCSIFCKESFIADCCLSKREIGYQEQMIRELYQNEKERHGYEEDWGLVIQKMNKEFTSVHQ